MHESSLTRVAASATLHCLTGCAIGEVIGSVIGSGLNWTNLATESLTIPLAFMTGYLFTMRPLIQNGITLKRALRLALALFVAFLAAAPVNYYLIGRGKGHAIVHQAYE